MPKENKSGMLLRFRRMSRLRLKLFLAFCAFANFLEIFCLRWSFLSSLDSSLAPHFGPQRIFIASTHWNNEAIIRSHWNTAILELVREIGVKNIYISIYESGSWDDTKGALRELKSLRAPDSSSETTFATAFDIAQDFITKRMRLTN
jgi:Cryptococcal mannosyltransferase 1